MAEFIEREYSLKRSVVEMKYYESPSYAKCYERIYGKNLKHMGMVTAGTRKKITSFSF